MTLGWIWGSRVMKHGRIETTPEQQLAELRQAYARYNTLADRLHDDDAVDAQVRAARERNARRIALAYEKSIASTAMRMESMHQAHAQSRGFTRLAKGLSLMLAGALIVCGALVAYLRPDIREKVAAFIPAREAPAAAPVAASAAQIAASMPAPAAATPAPPVESMPLVVPAPRPVQPEDQAVTRTAAIAPPSSPVAKKVAVPQKDETREAPRAVQSTPAPSVAAPIKQTETRPAEPSPPVSEPLVAAPPPPAPAQATVEPLSPPRDVAALPTPPQTSVQASAAEIPEAAVRVIETPVTPAPAAQPQTQTSKLVAVMRTHVRPPYPLDAKRAGEQGTTQMEVAISAQGAITDCKVTGTSGSERLDSTACSFVKRYWRWQPRETSGSTKIAVVWNLIAGR